MIKVDSSLVINNSEWIETFIYVRHPHMNILVGRRVALAGEICHCELSAI